MSDTTHPDGSDRPASPPTGPAAELLAAAFARGRLVDLTHPLVEGIPTYPTHAKYFQNNWLAFGDPARMNQLVLGEHTGTHVDSPCHFPVAGSHAATAVDQLPLTALVGRCAVVHTPVSEAGDVQVGVAPVLAWEQRNGRLREGDIVLFDFDWARTRWTPGPEGFAHLDRWPGLAGETAELLRERRVKAVGTDCVSLDPGDGGDGELRAHYTLLEEGILILENVANLDQLPDLAYFMAFPLPIVKGTGSPVRAVAVVDG
jgi:kynurenine formamidase